MHLVLFGVPSVCFPVGTPGPAHRGSRMGAAGQGFFELRGGGGEGLGANRATSLEASPMVANFTSTKA